MTQMDVEILLEKFMMARRGKWMLEPICKNASDKIIEFLIETAIDDFHDFPDKMENSTAAIIENLGLSGKKSVAVFLNSLLAKEELKRYHPAALKGKQNFCSVTDYTMEDIADLSVPDLEMSDFGERNFEFEGNIITVKITNDLKVSITDEVGERDKFDFLPSRILTKFIQDLEELLEELRLSFSDAIVSGRRWKFGVFEECILHHPVMHKFAQNLMLAEYNEYNRPKRIFHYFMGKFIDIKNQVVELSKTDKIGIVNSMDIDQRTLEEVKAKYPARLKQLTRGVYKPLDMEKGQPFVARFANFLLDYARFSDTLTAKGYTQGVSESKNLAVLYRINMPLGLGAKVIFSAPTKYNARNVRVLKIAFYSLDTLKRKNGKYASDRTPPLHTDRVNKYFFSDVLNDIYELL